MYNCILIWLGSISRRLWHVSFIHRLNSLHINCRSFRVLTKALFLAMYKVLYSVISGPVLSIVLEINQLEKLVRHTGGINVEGGNTGVSISVELLYVWLSQA